MPQNRPAPTPHEQPQAFLQHLYHVAVHSARPLHGMSAHLPAPPSPASGGRTVVLGAGKAGGAMAQALEALWPADAPLSGLMVTRYGHVPPRLPGLAQRIEVIQAGHPLPDAAGQQAAARMLALAQGLGAHDLVLCLISGGGSALLGLPAAGLALREKQRIQGGVQVDSVEDPAASAGILEGDIILAVNNTDIANAAQFAKVVAGLDKARAAALLVMRGEQSQWVTVTPK